MTQSSVLHHGEKSVKSHREGKGKAVPVLLTEHHAMKAYWGSGVIAPRILDLATRLR
jgi:hypothetical protein